MDDEQREQQRFDEMVETSNKNAQEQKKHTTKEANRVIESNQAAHLSNQRHVWKIRLLLVVYTVIS